RNLARSPLFQVMLSMQNTPAASADSYGIELERIEIARPTALFEMELAVVQPDAEIGLVLEYNRDLFERNTIASLLAQIHPVLEPLRHIRCVMSLTRTQRLLRF